MNVRNRTLWLAATANNNFVIHCDDWNHTLTYYTSRADRVGLLTYWCLSVRSSVCLTHNLALKRHVLELWLH